MTFDEVLARTDIYDVCLVNRDDGSPTGRKEDAVRFLDRLRYIAGGNRDYDYGRMAIASVTEIEEVLPECGP